MFRIKDNDNFKWTMKDLAQQYKYENPEWSWKKCWSKAKDIYRELNRLNNKMWKENAMYFKFFKPFSFHDDKDDEFSETYCDWTNK